MRKLQLLCTTQIYRRENDDLATIKMVGKGYHTPSYFSKELEDDGSMSEFSICLREKVGGEFVLASKSNIFFSPTMEFAAYIFPSKN